MSKDAITAVDIDGLLARRWSGRVYAESKQLSSRQIYALLEAARWAPSCYGEEPWRFIVCDRFVHAFAWEKAFSCLSNYNQIMAKRCPLLLASIASENFSASGKANRWARYDTGAASENICLQATSMGLVSHQMGGFDVNKLLNCFHIPANNSPMAILAIGYPVAPDKLSTEEHKYERMERKRRPIADNFFTADWGVGVDG